MTFRSPEAIKLLILSIIERHESPTVDPATVSDEFNMLAEGLLDSLGFVELMAELERRLGIEIDLGDLDPDELTTLGPLARYIVSRYGRSLPRDERQ
jgi:acyl carrier protein